MNSPPNFSLIASTRGLVHGSCCGPFGFAGAAGAAGFAPGGGGGGFGTAAFCSAGLAGSAGFGVCSLSFCSSATFKSREELDIRRAARHTKTWIQPHRLSKCQRPRQKIVAQSRTALLQVGPEPPEPERETAAFVSFVVTDEPYRSSRRPR